MAPCDWLLQPHYNIHEAHHVRTIKLHHKRRQEITMAAANIDVSKLYILTKLESGLIKFRANINSTEDAV
jgi:hypothetical protein